MSRGGRGGARGGLSNSVRRRPKDGRPLSQREELERQAQERITKHVSYAPHQRYPKMDMPVSPAPTAWETGIIEKWKDNLKKIREGPYYVDRVIGHNTRISKLFAAKPSTSTFNAMPTYSQRYQRNYRSAPDLSGKLWLKPFLPEELWDIVDPSLRKSGGTDSQPAKTTKTNFNIDGINEDDELEDDEEGEEDSDAEAKAREDEIDETWGDDEDADMDWKKREKNDYNAEQYFDNGDEDNDLLGVEYEEDDAAGGDDFGGEEYGPDDEFDV